jgi:trehalose 6-phosphate phosphatase
VELPAVLGPLVAAPERSAFFVDFDGSLAPIVDDPSRARALPAASAALTRLVARLARVAVVSGRPVGFLADRLHVEDLTLVGLYGLERDTGDRRWIDPRAVPWTSAIEAAAVALDTRLPGVHVERKGDLAVTVHWRTTPERGAEAVRVATEVSDQYRLAAPLHGRMAIELRPPINVDKGTAVEGLVDGLDAAAFAGDDAGDLPAFSALARLRSGGVLTAAVAIGVRSREAPGAVLDADVVVDGPAGLAALMDALADAIDGRA